MNSITINLDDKEFDALESLALEKELSHQKVMRQALAVYQLVNERQKQDPSFSIGILDDMPKKLSVEISFMKRQNCL